MTQVAVSHKLACEAKVSQTKAEVALKEANDELVTVEAESRRQKVELERSKINHNITKVELDRVKVKLETKTFESESHKSKLDRLWNQVSQLEEEKEAIIIVMQEEKARLIEEFITKKDASTDMAMYKIWSMNPDIDTSFLAEKEQAFLEKWRVHLAEEEVVEVTTQEAGTCEEKGDKVESGAVQQ
ncbi:uncharacterized protein LOC133785837 [Humulus lupulus]|uniref:uncharacterized protein LOC133785837 n=1 Tax=Humulus lupulus TaxID=3486 RepID=UPI002B409CC7|nr:uncharacterized protein LOC133785837 [Humulus lupulus]